MAQGVAGSACWICRLVYALGFEGFKVLVLRAISDARFGLQWGIYGSGMGLFFATA